VLTGAYAEFAAVDTRQAVRLNCEMPTAEAAGFFINYGTAYSALLQRAHGRGGETVLILGASGGVGLAAVQLAKALGMIAIADCRGDAKQSLAREHGADLVLDYTRSDFRSQIQSFTKDTGCDIVIDMVGGDATQAALKCIAWCGRIVIIGFTSGSAFRIPANHLLVKNCSVIGHWWGDYHRRDRKQLDDAFIHLFQLYREKRLRPIISDILELRDVPDGIRRLANRSVAGKLVTVL
jgi:NADPH2:quinone reductase